MTGRATAAKLTVRHSLVSPGTAVYGSRMRGPDEACRRARNDGCGWLYTLKSAWRSSGDDPEAAVQASATASALQPSACTSTLLGWDLGVSGKAFGSRLGGSTVGCDDCIEISGLHRPGAGYMELPPARRRGRRAAGAGPAGVPSSPAGLVWVLRSGVGFRFFVSRIRVEFGVLHDSWSGCAGSGRTLMPAGHFMFAPRLRGIDGGDAQVWEGGKMCPRYTG